MGKNKKKKRKTHIVMQNEDGKVVDMYVPRKCSYSNRVVTAKDHASVNFNIGHIDANGTYTGEFTPLCVSGFIRSNAGGDDAVNRLAAEKGLMKDLYTFPAQHKFRDRD